jgi:hypothetical protein
VQGGWRIRQRQLAGLDLGVVEDIVEDRHERRSGRSSRPDQTALVQVENGVPEQVESTENAVHRRANLVAHGRQKLRLGLVGGFGGLLGDLQRRHGSVRHEAVPDGLLGGGREFSRGAKHGYSECRDQRSQQDRHGRLLQKEDDHDAAELGNRQQDERAADERQEEGRDRDPSAGEHCIRGGVLAIEVGENAESADAPHHAGQQ